MMNARSLPAAIDELLQPLGFQGKRWRWNRRDHTIIDVVTVQRSKALDGVFVNVGVHESSVYRRWWGHDAVGLIDEADCVVRARLPVLATGYDRVFDPRIAEDVSAVVDLLAGSGLEFFESMR